MPMVIDPHENSYFTENLYIYIYSPHVERIELADLAVSFRSENK